MFSRKPAFLPEIVAKCHPAAADFEIERRAFFGV
jgi:hypothetical protein